MTHRSRARHCAGPDDRGTVSLVVALALVPLTLFLAVVVDTGRVWVARVTLQNGVEAAAAATARTWVAGGPVCSSSDLQTASKDGAVPSSLSCTPTGTSLRGSVTVAAAGDIPFMFAGLLGRSSGRTSASTGVRIGPAVTMRGLWPLALCVNHPAVSRWVGSSLSVSTDEVITFESTSSMCGNVPGNWAVLDFNGGENSTAETRDWVRNGWDGTVSVGDLVPGNTGVPSTSADIASMTGREVSMVLFDTATGTGSNARFHVVGFARGLLVAVVQNGPSARRSLTVRFVRGTTDGQAGNGGTPHYGISTWSTCSHDGQGDCS